MTTRDRIVIMVVLALGAVVAGWMLVVSPKRDQAAALSTQISAQQTQLDSARSQLAAGETARSAFAGRYAELAKLGEAVPPDDDVPSLIYQVQNAARGAKVSFRGLQLTSASGASTTTAPAPSTTTPSTSGSTGTPATGTTPAAGATAPAPTQLPPGAAVGSAGLPTEQFTFTLTGNFFHLADFFNRLQSFVTSRGSSLLISGRLMTINGIQGGPRPSVARPLRGSPGHLDAAVFGMHEAPNLVALNPLELAEHRLVVEGMADPASVDHQLCHGIQANAGDPCDSTQGVPLSQQRDDLRAFVGGKLVHAVVLPNATLWQETFTLNTYFNSILT